MHKQLNWLILFLTVFIANSILSQNFNDTIFLINSKQIICNVTEITYANEYTDGTISYALGKKPNKTKTINSENVFSINNEKGEKLIYHFDEAGGNELTVDEMRYYILGQKDAKKRKNGYVCLALNLIISAGARSEEHNV